MVDKLISDLDVGVPASNTEIEILLDGATISTRTDLSVVFTNLQNTFAKAVKPADETVNNSDTLQDDDDLLFAASASKTYGMLVFYFVISTTAADFKYGLSIPTGATADRSDGTWSSIILMATQDFETSQNVATGTALGLVCISARIIMGTTAGNVVNQWAQQAATVADTLAKQGSYMVVWEE